MSAAIEDKRPALVSSELYGFLVRLNGFRHVVRHRYGFDLDLSKVDENLARVRIAFPSFVDAVAGLERLMAFDRAPTRSPWHHLVLHDKLCFCARRSEQRSRPSRAAARSLRPS